MQNEELFESWGWPEQKQDEPTFEFAGKTRANLGDLYSDIGSWYADMF